MARPCRPAKPAVIRIAVSGSPARPARAAGLDPIEDRLRPTIEGPFDQELAAHPVRIRHGRDRAPCGTGHTTRSTAVTVRPPRGRRHAHTCRQSDGSSSRFQKALPATAEGGQRRPTIPREDVDRQRATAGAGPGRTMADIARPLVPDRWRTAARPGAGAASPHEPGGRSCRRGRAARSPGASRGPSCRARRFGAHSAHQPLGA